jgi:ArsR family transcriptional regulator
MRVELTVIQPFDRIRGCSCELPAEGDLSLVEAQADAMAALADPVRLRLLRLIRSAPSPACVCDLTAAVGLSQATVSHHLARLRRAGFIRTERAGIWSFHVLNPEMPDPAARILDAIV